MVHADRLALLQRLQADGQLVRHRDETTPGPKDPGLMQDAADACGS